MNLDGPEACIEICQPEVGNGGPTNIPTALLHNPWMQKKSEDFLYMHPRDVAVQWLLHQSLHKGAI